MATTETLILQPIAFHSCLFLNMTLMEHSSSAATGLLDDILDGSHNAYTHDDEGRCICGIRRGFYLLGNIWVSGL